VIYDGTWGEGNLYNFYMTVIPKLMGTAKNEFSLAKDGITRNEYGDLQIALREAFINSLIHADYRIDDRIQISCTNKAYIFSNPGSLRISIEDFYAGKTSYPRNPSIAFMFRMIGLAEEAGSGVTAILKATKSYRLPRPELDTTDERVRLIIKTEPLLDVLTEQYNLSEREFLVLKAINDFTYIKRTEIEKVTKLSRNITLQTVNLLLQKGLIKQIGKSSATKYTISEEHINRKEKTISLLEQLLEFYKNE
jgi:predicted HTH transcriptional regulator